VRWAPNPTPCLICGKALDSACATITPYDTRLSGFTGYQSNQPSGGTYFETYGNYGSTLFDSFGTERMEISICDTCLRPRLHRVRIIQITHRVRCEASDEPRA
jgi:hypothetical protein